MSERAEEFKRAYHDGHTAEVGADNPYYGTGLCARLWMAGYRRMLRETIAATKSQLRYQAHRDGLAARAPWN